MTAPWKLFCVNYEYTFWGEAQASPSETWYGGQRSWKPGSAVGKTSVLPTVLSL